jgi:hypothetical protein
MDQLPERVARWWARLDDAERRRSSVLAWIGVAYLVHYLVYTLGQPFFIEDAGISFAFARHLVEGDGLAAWPGGERVEGYSNALWTFLIAALYGLGVPVWTAAKLLGAAFGLVTLPLVYGIARMCRPGAPSDAALLAPALLAASTQFVLWNASGLENSAFGLLLAAGVWQLLRELRHPDGGRPWSALWFMLLSMTRPEGLAYGAFAALTLGMDAVVTRRPRPLLRWALAFAVPFVAYNAWRYWYFAWPLPNTFYAKAGKGTQFKPWAWDTDGWKYIKGWFTRHHVIWATPLLVAALAGLRGPGRWLGLGALGLLGGLLAWDGKAGWTALGLDGPPGEWKPALAAWSRLRVGGVAATLALGGLLTLGRPGWRARGLLWISACFGGFFALYAGGDWMVQHRWFHIVVVALAPLFAAGVGELLDALPAASRRLPWPPEASGVTLNVRALALALAALGWTAVEVPHIASFSAGPETSVRDIYRRVRYMAWVQRKLDLDDVTLLDVDMGAHMYFSGWSIVDIAGLVDVPMAQHSNFDKKFIREYLWQQRVPDFAHVHAGWARSSRIPQHPEWRQQYLEIPGYPIGGRRLHVGNHIRKGIFVDEQQDPAPPEAPRFGDGVRLLRWEVPSPEVAAGGTVFIDTQWQAPRRSSDFRIIAYLVQGDEVVHSAAFAPGYGWYPASSWKPTERVSGGYRMRLPADLPPGEYRIGVGLIDAAGGAPLAVDPPRGAHQLFPGDWLSEEVVRVVSPAEAAAAAGADLAAAQAAAADGDCDAVWPAWKRARRHVEDDEAFIRAGDAEVREALAGCLVARADAAADTAARVALLAEARRWRRHHPALAPRADALAAQLLEEGDALFAEADWAAAQERYEQALSLDPGLSWARRKAEDARDAKLDIQRPGRKRDAGG